jgi:glycosyltransferase involved in cell wall biosynthesis
MDQKYDYEDEIMGLGGKIVRIQDNRRRNPARFIRDIGETISREGIDIVHAQVDMSNAYTLIAAERQGVLSRIAHSHNTKFGDGGLVNNMFNIWAKRAINKYATTRLAPELESGRAMFGRYEFNVVRNAIDLKRFKFDRGCRKEVRDKYGIGSKDKVLLHIGRFEKAKNHKFLMDVFSEYVKSYATAKLIMLGDGSLRREMESMTKDSDVGNNVIFADTTSEVYKYYSAADVFVMPSLWEGLPVVLVEAQANGLPCVVSNNVDRKSDMGGVGFVDLGDCTDVWTTEIESRRRDSTEINNKLLGQYSVITLAKKMRRVYG